MKLQDYTNLTVEQQRLNQKKIIALFKEFWSTNPDEEAFTRTTEGLVLFPEIIYHMTTNKPKKKIPTLL